MKRICLLIFLAILLGSVGFCADDEPRNLRKQAYEIEEETPQVEEIERESAPQDLVDTASDDIAEIYRSLEVPTFRYVHDLDPEEYIDTQYSTWSPYSLFRLTAPLYFKTITIPPGYYLLTPRQHGGDWYMLFKVAGKVKYIVPIYDKKMVPMGFYKDNLPEEKTTWSQKQHLRLLKFVGKFKSSKRPEIPKTYLDAEDLDDNFIIVILYWGDYKYYMVLRSVPM